MIRDELYKSFIEYLSTNGVNQVEVFDNCKTLPLEFINEEKIEIQLNIIKEFHDKVIGYKGHIGIRIDNKTGSTVEQYKVNIKRLKRYLKNIRINTANSDFERKLLKEGFEYLQRAESCISEVYNAGYMSIIERSMKRVEICIGSTGSNNITKNGDRIEIIRFDKCCYNNIEMDCFDLLNRYKSKGIKLDYKRLADNFCELEGLEENSSRLILALLSYPYNFMRCCDRYREKKKDWTEEEYEDRLLKAIIKDGESLV